MKCVMIIDPDLPRGLQLNAAASLGVSLASRVADLAGGPAVDADGCRYEGITNIPIPVLALDRDGLARKLGEARSKVVESEPAYEGRPDALHVFVFSDVAQASLRYDDYVDALRKKGSEEIIVLGLCLYGPKKLVNGLSGNLPMLR